MRPEDLNIMDIDAVIAAVDLVGRCGARNIEIGWLNENVPVEAADWYATASFAGARIIEEHHSGPAEACEGLAFRLLLGAQCKGCGGLIAFRPDGAFAYENAVLSNGEVWTIEEAIAAPQCRWTRTGQHWNSECGR